MTHPGPHHAASARHRAESDAAAARGSVPDGALGAAPPTAQHAARARRAARIGVVFAVAGVAALLVGTTAAVTAAMAGGPTAADARVADGQRLDEASAQTPPPMVSSPTPIVTPTPIAVAPCAMPGVAAALKKGDDDAVVAAMGGGAAVRAAVVAGEAPCIDLADPERTWVVIDKVRPYEPLDYRPSTLGPVNGVRSISGGWLRADAGAAMTKLVAGAKKAGVGELAMESAYRSYRTQVTSYGSQVSSKGRAEADKVSARPGFSEHQSGLTADMVACGGGCGSLDALASTSQGRWLKANAWRYGYIVRYEKCCTKTTGYSPEPWHIRYIGVALATAYHDGGFHTLEEFWGLPAAPDYAD